MLVKFISSRIISACLGALAMILLPNGASAQQCTALLDHRLQKLHSIKQVDLCEAFQGKPLLIVNTASHCGFTGQFRGLEALYQEYQQQGLEILGVPSNSFKQEAASEADTAKICYRNYGVTFTMTAPQPVTGEAAHPLFQELKRQSGHSPRWNFHKFLVNEQGQVVSQFPSHIKPSDPALRDALNGLL